MACIGKCKKCNFGYPCHFSLNKIARSDSKPIRQQPLHLAIQTTLAQFFIDALNVLWHFIGNSFLGFCHDYLLLRKHYGPYQ